MFDLLVLGLFLTTTPPDTTARALGYAAGGGAVALMLFGPIVRPPLSQTANWLAVLGVIVCAGTILYYFTVFPWGWTRPNGNVGGIVIYAAGVVLMLTGGVFMPMVQTRSERERVEALARAGALEQDLEATEASLAETLEDLEETDAALTAARATLAAEEESQAAFEMYEDSAGQWRWRLGHRNGNAFGDSGEGYTRRADAREAIDG
jgi:uncharacterized protein YegP (UPF0339 family)